VQASSVAYSTEWLIRRQLWEDGLFQTSGQSRDMVKIPAPLAQRLLDAACFPLEHSPAETQPHRN